MLLLKETCIFVCELMIMGFSKRRPYNDLTYGLFSMYRKFIPFVLGLLLFFACSPVTTVEIRTVCERDDIGNYIIKWETTPAIDGILKVYVSNSPCVFDHSRPVGYVNIPDGVTTYITNDNITRKYFHLLFADKYTKTVCARKIKTDHVQNFRDIGGYKTAEKKYIQWGKVYRSGAFIRINDWDSIRINRLNIKTLIDLRSPSEKSLNPVSYQPLNIKQIPIYSESLRDVFPRISEGRMKKGDVYLMLQDRYLDYVALFEKEIGQALTIFADEKNYPIVISSSFGKDRAGLLTCLLLHILDVPEETIIKDYLLSNKYIEKEELAYLVQNSNMDVQEALTTFLSVDEQLYHLFFKQIKEKYGTVGNYLTKKIGITEKEQERIKTIILE